MLAQAVVRLATRRGDTVAAFARVQLDVSDPEAVLQCVGGERPDAVIHCAAYTAVDKAEAEPELALQINAEGARHVARACQKFGCSLVYPSTDYVFDGRSDRPYRVSDPTNPLSVYGRTKRLGEIAAAETDRALVVRTSWLYGEGGPNFVDTISRLARERDVLDVVADQIGRPTSTETLAETIGKLLNAGAVGTFHVSEAGLPVSWAGYAEEVVGMSGLRAAVHPIASAELNRPAPRPSYSVLDLTETEQVVGALPDWRASLARYLSRRME